MYSTISPVAKFYQQSNWLSIGDGRFGLDSFRLNKKFNLNIYPTDIAENMLRRGREMGIIKEYGIENAEALSFQDNAYDVVFCKEALHHFPRPVIGLYEMIRVASEVVILIEPNDEPNISKNKYILNAMKLVISKIFNKRYSPDLPLKDSYYNVHGSFEPSGNYIYKISNREINKIVHALDLGGMAFYRFNDAYETGVEFENVEDNNILFSKIKQAINKADKSGNFNLSTTIIFKHKVDEDLKRKMTESGFIFPNKINNPIPI